MDPLGSVCVFHSVYELACDRATKRQRGREREKKTMFAYVVRVAASFQMVQVRFKMF